MLSLPYLYSEGATTVSVILRSPVFPCSVPAVERSTTVGFCCCLTPSFLSSLWSLCNLHDCSPQMVPYVRDALLQARATEPHSDENRAPSYQAFLIVMTVVVVIAIVVRFWSRALATPQGRLTSHYWWDDWLALIAVVRSALDKSPLKDVGNSRMQNCKER
jgi:hypothetical protein